MVFSPHIFADGAIALARWVMNGQKPGIYGAEDALVFGSGIAAITIPVLALLKSGDEVICVENPYSWTIKLFKNFLPKFFSMSSQS